MIVMLSEKYGDNIRMGCPFLLFYTLTIRTLMKQRGNQLIFFWMAQILFFLFNPVQNLNRRYVVILGQYRTGLKEIRRHASEKICRTQELAKQYYDKRQRVFSNLVRIGERVLVFVPTEKGRSSHPKLVGEHASPYRVVELPENVY